MKSHPAVPPKILRSHALFTANNGVVCFGVGRVIQSFSLSLPTWLLLYCIAAFTKLPSNCVSASSRVPQLQFNQTLLFREFRQRQRLGWGTWESFLGSTQKFRDEASSDEEDDALGHHDLVVVLHLAQGRLDLR